MHFCLVVVVDVVVVVVAGGQSNIFCFIFFLFFLPTHSHVNMECPHNFFQKKALCTILSPFTCFLCMLAARKYCCFFFGINTITLKFNLCTLVLFPRQSTSLNIFLTNYESKENSVLVVFTLSLPLFVASAAAYNIYLI